MKAVEGPGKFFAQECDITKEENVVESFRSVKNSFGSLSILINNAGAIKHNTIEGTLIMDFFQSRPH